MKKKEAKTWDQMTNEERLAFFIEICKNTGAYANPKKPFYC